VEPERPERDPFDWLTEDAQRRRGGLRLIRQAVRRGWLDGPEHAGRRALLMEALGRLVEDRSLPPRHVVALARTYMEMAAANFGLKPPQLQPMRRPRFFRNR
jgi:hypothetical protein